jgi:magnesium transporter
VPPTLLASLWGMNFTGMPELDWSFGYPIALLVIFGSMIGQLIYFRKKKWF